jgi:hypothetical protein
LPCRGRTRGIRDTANRCSICDGGSCIAVWPTRWPCAVQMEDDRTSCMVRTAAAGLRVGVAARSVLVMGMPPSVGAQAEVGGRREGLRPAETLRRVEAMSRLRLGGSRTWDGPGARESLITRKATPQDCTRHWGKDATAGTNGYARWAGVGAQLRRWWTTQRHGRGV